MVFFQGPGESPKDASGRRDKALSETLPGLLLAAVVIAIGGVVVFAFSD